PAERPQTARFLSALARRPRSAPRIGVYRPSSAPGLELIAHMRMFEERLMASHLMADGDPLLADVIYVMTAMDDSPNFVEPSLPGGMTGEILGREFQRRRAPGSKPFVVLHSPMPQSISNALEQLFARNQFAQALVNRGAVSGVLATSITVADDPDRQD